jgi:hypothetical protein
MTAQFFLLIMVYSLLSMTICLLLYRALISGFFFRMYHLMTALPGILFDVAHHTWLSIVELFPKRKKRDAEIELDDYERMLS